MPFGKWLICNSVSEVKDTEQLMSCDVVLSQHMQQGCRGAVNNTLRQQVVINPPCVAVASMLDQT